MQKRTSIYLRLNSPASGTDQGLISVLQQAVEDRADMVAGVYTDDGRITGKGRNQAWRRLLTDLHSIDQIVLSDAGDLPGRTVNDLLNIMAVLTANAVSILVPHLEIDTSTGSAAVLELVRAFRRAKVSQAIRRGQEKARAAGRHIGRPPIPMSIRRRIVAALAEGNGIRPTARRFGVGAASVVTIRQEMLAATDQQAA